MENYMVRNDEEYRTIIQKIATLSKKGEKKLTGKRTEKLKLLTSAVETYRNTVYTIPAPTTLKEVIELKMYERKLKQKDLAKLLGLGEAKLSQIMSEKRKPDVAFLKSLHKQLGIDGNTIFKYV